MFHGRNTMFGNGRLAARTTLAVGLLAGLAMLTATPALAAPGAATAPAARTAPAGTGAFRTWAAAQKAAGFALYVPKRTAGLKFVPAIGVSRCKATAKVRFDVTSEWGAPKTHLLLDQNTTSAACLGSIPALPPLAIYRVAHVTYRLVGACGVAPLPSCSSKSAVLIMTWKIGPRFYTVFSQGLLRGALLPFATSIKKV
jgi:hypothetical protein